MKKIGWKRGGQRILSNIDWEVKEGENWGILGLNGSGKTSLLNVLLGYQFPTSGEVSILGNRFGETNMPELRKKIGFVSSSLDRFSSTIDYETAEEVVVSGKFASFGLYEQVDSRDWGKAKGLLEKFRLEYLLGKPYHTLSQGEKRRILIARSLMNSPKLLILDEPCTGLDVRSREEVLSLTKEITGRNMLYVTHHIEELVDGISHVLLLDGGKVAAAGRKQEVLNEEKLSNVFRVPVHVTWEGNRPWLRVKD